MKILVLVTKFDLTGTKPYLTDELTAELQQQGHAVDTVFLDWYREYSSQQIHRIDGQTIHIIQPLGGRQGLFPRVFQWVFSSFRVARYCKKTFLHPGAHDLLIAFSPSIVFAAALFLLRSVIKKRMLIQWDFFPFHQAQIGLVPYEWMTRIGAMIEASLINTFTDIGCMSPRNVEYLKQHYRLSESIRTTVLPIWAKPRPQPVVDRSRLRERYGIPRGSFVAIFGGQIAAGRGIEEIVELARLAKGKSSNIRLVVIGDGPKKAWLQKEATSLVGYLIVLPSLKRSDYLELVASCDIGLVMTVSGVDIPSFPSKILDYCCVGLPVVAAIERSTDFGEIISAQGFGLYCEASDFAKMFNQIDHLRCDPQKVAIMGDMARWQYENHYCVRSTATELAHIFLHG